MTDKQKLWIGIGVAGLALYWLYGRSMKPKPQDGKGAGQSATQEEMNANGNWDRATTPHWLIPNARGRYNYVSANGMPCESPTTNIQKSCQCMKDSKNAPMFIRKFL